MSFLLFFVYLVCLAYTQTNAVKRSKSVAGIYHAMQRSRYC